jgi:hypothetical protein
LGLGLGLGLGWGGVGRVLDGFGWVGRMVIGQLAGGVALTSVLDLLESFIGIYVDWGGELEGGFFFEGG